MLGFHRQRTFDRRVRYGEFGRQRKHPASFVGLSDGDLANAGILGWRNRARSIDCFLAAIVVLISAMRKFVSAESTEECSVALVPRELQSRMDVF